LVEITYLFFAMELPMKKIIVIMSMLVIFCIAAGSIIMLVGGRDIDQPDIADLIPEVLAVPEEQNGFFALMAAADAIVLPPDLMVIIDYLLGETVDAHKAPPPPLE
jgi:hypothetical protein